MQMSFLSMTIKQRDLIASTVWITFLQACILFRNNQRVWREGRKRKEVKRKKNWENISIGSNKSLNMTIKTQLTIFNTI